MSGIAAAATMMGRRHAEGLMTSTATVRRATGAFTTDPVTLEEVPVYVVVLSGVRCKVKLSGGRPSDAAVPGQVAAEFAPEWHVPMSTVGIVSGDLVTIDTVDAVSGDPESVGKSFRIEGPFLRDFATARRFRIVGWS